MLTPTWTSARAGGAEDDRRAHRGDEAVGDPPGVLGAGQVVEEDRELVAAEAGDGVVRAQLVGQAGADRRQQQVAGLVPVRVVDLLEAVEVEEQDGERARARAQAAGAAQGMGDAVGEQRAVRQPGQRVVQRLVDELAARAGQVVDHRVERGDRGVELGVGRRRDPPGQVPGGHPAGDVGQRGEGLGAAAPSVEHGGVSTPQRAGVDAGNAPLDT